MYPRIRKAKLKNADEIAALSKELGYLPESKEIKNKLRRISRNSEQEVFVGESKNVIGWMHIALTEPLESSPFIEIRGIVVKEEFRGKGTGTKLIAAAEPWARSKACSRIRIRTNITRLKTREYYRRMDFISRKTQEVFEKEIK
jgi:N-acetylglutamate synthase-like GNAT family acetyltransferase